MCLGIFLPQQKYVLDILSKVGLLGCKIVDTPMETNAKLLPYQGDILNNPSRYQKLVGKLNYLTVTRHDFAFVVSVVSPQFLSGPKTSH